jgi:hypothetical protein
MHQAKKIPLDDGRQMGLVFPADEVRASSRTHRLFQLPAGVYAPVTTCDANVIPSGTIVNPPWTHWSYCFQQLAPSLSRQDARESALPGARIVRKPGYTQTRFETGVYGKTDVVIPVMGAWPSNQDGERYLTMSCVLESVKAWSQKIFLPWDPTVSLVTLLFDKAREKYAKQKTD